MIALAGTAYALGIEVLIALSQELQAQELEVWLRAIQNSEVAVKTLSWEDDAKRFWKTDSNTLMRMYYSGLPHQLLSALKTNLGQASAARKAQWMLDLVEQAGDASRCLLKGVPANGFDNSLGHRLQVFPVIITAQCLCIADDDNTRQDLANCVAKLLYDAQLGAGFTESARDQINQIVPQVLTDQLIAGPVAWNNLVVTDNVLEQFVRLGKNPELASRFETGLALSLQFLVYYRRSLDSRLKALRHRCRKHAEIIDNYCGSLRDSPDPVLRSMLPWVDALQVHAKSARGVRALARQSSAAVIAHHRDNRSVPLDLWKMCVLNNLRAAYQSRGLPDCESRLKRVSGFLGANGVTKAAGLEVLGVVDKTTRSDFYDYVREFVRQLPETASKPEPDTGVVSTAHGLTVIDLWSYMRPYHRGKKLEEFLTPLAVPLPSLHKLVVHTVRPIVRSLVSITGESERRQRKLTGLINKIVNEEYHNR